eukprot:gene11100-14895_t
MSQLFRWSMKIIFSYIIIQKIYIYSLSYGFNFGNSILIRKTTTTNRIVLKFSNSLAPNNDGNLNIVNEIHIDKDGFLIDPAQYDNIPDSDPIASVNSISTSNNAVYNDRDLDDVLMERAMRFFDESVVRTKEKCYLVGLEDKSSMERNDKSKFTMEESLTELSELAGAAGLSVVGSTYQRVQRPNVEYYIGPGKAKDILRSVQRLHCHVVIFDVELTPSQQKSLELIFNQEVSKSSKRIKIIDRTALILDIFAQHAKTKEGQLQVQLALLTYRLPRLTNLWSHLERQSAGSKGRSNGGVGLRGPGEKQLESDRREMKTKIVNLNKAINNVRRHRSMHRKRRRRLGLPVIALVGYTNSGKSTLLNALTNPDHNKMVHTTDDYNNITLTTNLNNGGNKVFAADMLFATLDPTTRIIQTTGTQFPDLLLTDTVGFIQKLPTNLVAAFRATLEEITEADILLHVTDITNDSWKKQEAAVLTELSNMGLSDKPVITIWNKIDLINDRKEYFKYEAMKRPQTVAISATTGEGFDKLMNTVEEVLSFQMDDVNCSLPYHLSPKLDLIHRVSIINEIQYLDDYILIKGRMPRFLKEQLYELIDNKNEDNNDYFDINYEEMDDASFDTYDNNDINNDMNEDNEDDDLLQNNNIKNNDDEYDESNEYNYTVLPDDDDEENNNNNKNNWKREKINSTDNNDSKVDWVALGKGRHSAVKKYSASSKSSLK